MKITYTGRHIEISPAQSEKLQAEFIKAGKLLDNGWGEAEARVVLSHDKHPHLNHAEVTVAYHHHELVGEASDSDLFTAVHAAVKKLEAQAIRVKDKWREGRKAPRPEAGDSIQGD